LLLLDWHQQHQDEPDRQRGLRLHWLRRDRSWTGQQDAAAAVEQAHHPH
jgi:hypothetical protein